MRDFFKTIGDSFRIRAGLLIGATAVLYALLLNNLNLWSDEIYSVLIAKDSIREMFHLLMTEDSKPPLYYLYLKGILALFPPQYEIFAAHFASYILLIAAQAFAATAVRRDFGDRTALWLIFLMAAMPHSLWLAFEARTYMLSSFLMLIALIYGLRLLREPQTRDFAKFGTITVLALYSHYYCAIWLAFLYAGLLFELIRLKKYALLKKFLLTAAGAAALFAPWLAVPLATGGKISRFWYVTDEFVLMSPMFFYDPLAPDISQSVFFMATFAEALSFSFIALVGVFEIRREPMLLRRLFWTALGTFILAYALLWALSFLVRPMVTARYLKIFSLIWYVAGAVVLAQNKILQKAFLTVAALGFTLTYQDARYAFFDRGYVTLANDIRQFVPKNTTLVTLDNSNLYCEYYLPEYKCLLLVGEYGEILRLPSLMKNIELYKQEPAPYTFVISSLTKIFPADDCVTYHSAYRFNQTGMNLCKVQADPLRKLLQNSIKLRLNKYETH